jgi:hypothetical protein
MPQYEGRVRVTELKYNKKEDVLEEIIHQLMEIGPFICAPEKKWQILHTRASSRMHPLEPGKTYKFYHQIY